MSSSLSPDYILAQLQTIASQLRQYRLHRFGKTLPTASLDQTGAETIADEIPANVQSRLLKLLLSSVRD